VNFDVNVSSSFLALILDVYLEEDVPSNLNQVEGWSFKIIIDYLKAMSIGPHSSNELKSLNYNKIKVKYVSSSPITINSIIFELSPIHLPIGHSRQMQVMDRKYNGHVWCKVKTSNMKNNFVLGFRSTKCLLRIQAQLVRFH
jgi:hypothetical protein